MQIVRELSVIQIDDLVPALLNCRTMQHVERRNLVLDDLRLSGVEAVDQISRFQDNQTDIRQIVLALSKAGVWDLLIKRVLHHEGQAAAAAELKVIELEFGQNLFDHQTVRQLRAIFETAELDKPKVIRVFHECAQGLNVDLEPELQMPYPQLLILAGFPRQKTGFAFRALEFADKIAKEDSPSFRDKLRQIVDEIARKMEISESIRLLRDQNARSGANGETTLLFEMKPKGEAFLLRAFLLGAAGDWTTLPTEDYPVSGEAAKQKFRELVSLSEQRSTNLVIEMILPREMLCSPVELWEIDIGGYPSAVGAQYPLVLRWLDRLRDSRLEPRWKRKWESVEDHSGEALWLERTNQFHPRQLLAILAESADKGVFISFAFTPSSCAEPSGDPLSVALNGGTPVAVWWRECDSDPGKAQAELQKLLTHKRLTDLPMILKRIRNDAEKQNDAKHPGYRIALLYDSHQHRPPKLAG